MPDDLGERHILVNVPAFHMAVRDRGASVLNMKVIVGKQDRATPLFAAEMKEIVFSPYWNVPDSIAEGETAPAAARDPRFLARNNIEILRRGGGSDEIVDPASVDWDSPEAIKSLAFRQKPGAKNALGHVKFLMPNPYDVYLHDTLADSLFEREGRALSHGCVRLDQPEALATYLLRGNPEWTTAKIQTAMNQEHEQHVALKEPLPVYVVYFTAWPRAGGGVDSWPDVYGYDARQARAH
jgi:murein L,D-transpeptidase YcbB/YkuD